MRAPNAEIYYILILFLRLVSAKPTIRAQMRYLSAGPIRANQYQNEGKVFLFLWTMTG